MIKRRWKKGVFFIPTLLTIGNILCGFFAVVASFEERWLHAAVAIGVAFVLDGLDGRIARLADAETEFGLELDSLADLVSFGVAPAVLAYTRWLAEFNRLGLLLAFIFVCGSAMRLARFNAHDVKQESLEFFNGFPTPASAGVVVSLYFIEYKLYMENRIMSAEVYQLFLFLIPLIMLGLSYLMLSNVRYPTFKKMTWLEEHPFGVLFILLVAVFIAVLFPYAAFVTLFLGYLSIGVLDLWRVLTGIFSTEEVHSETD